MSNNISIKKTIYDKDEFNKVVNKNFTFFTQEVVDEPLTVDEFFNVYEDLYLQIPTEGDINSHEYLIKKSSELVNIDKDTEDIQPLLDEIAQLRQQLLQANEEILNLQESNLNNVK